MRYGQGLIRFIVGVMFLISLYYLSFTVVGTFFEKSQSNYVAQQTQSFEGASQDTLRTMQKYYENKFKDSFTSNPYLDLFLIKYDYKNITKNQINLGLDLKGGMSFVMEVNQEDILKSLANNSKNVTFKQALELATKKQQNSQESYLDLLVESYNEIDPNAKLAEVFAANPKYQEELVPSDENEKVVNVITKDVNSAIGNTYNVIKSRVNQFGVAEPIVSLQEGAGRIIVELPGADDLPRIKKLLESSARLEFWYTYDNRDVYESIVAANETLQGLEEIEGKKEKEETKTEVVAASDSSITAAPKEESIFDKLEKKSETDTSSSKVGKSNPIFDIFSLNVNPQNGQVLQGPVVGYAAKNDIDKLNALFAKEEVKKDIRRDIRLVWGAQPVDENGKFYPLYAIKANTEKAPLSGDAIASSARESDQFGKPSIGMVMTPQGAASWEKMTDIASSDPKGKQCIAIVLDNIVYSAPTVQNKISGGKSQITGKFSPEEAKDLSNILNSGKIDAPAKVIQEELVGPSLGANTIKSGLLSLLIGLLAILGFMFFVFRKPGGISDISLVINLFFLLGVLSSIKATLTLPGIAGIVLIIGAAVDANVIIFERVKEELRNGLSYWKALAAGFKHSYSTIFDANATTLITSLSLMFFGYGPIKGFAVTLTIGIFTSIFCAVFLTREIFNYNEDKGKEVPFVKSIIDKYFIGSNFEFIKKRKFAYMFSSFFILIGLISIFTRGFDLGVDFKGGRSYVVSFDKDVDASSIKDKLANSFDKNIVVKTYGEANQVQITSSYLYGIAGESREEAKKNDDIVLDKVYTGVKSFYTNSPDAESFAKYNVNNFRKIDATIADDIRNSAKMVAIFALVGIFIYVSLRFNRWQFAVGAIVALIHDTLFTLGILSLLKDVLPFSLELNQSIIAAVLTIIGFSTNDTVVIFDRIREFSKRFPNQPLPETINKAINDTLSRTVMTATTLFIVSLVLFIFGGESIRGFAFTMLVGIFVGTLSSIFVASPISLDLINMFEKKKVTDKAPKTKKAKK